MWATLLTIWINWAKVLVVLYTKVSSLCLTTFIHQIFNHCLPRTVQRLRVQQWAKPEELRVYEGRYRTGPKQHWLRCQCEVLCPNSMACAFAWNNVIKRSLCNTVRLCTDSNTAWLSTSTPGFVHNLMKNIWCYTVFGRVC